MKSLFFSLFCLSSLALAVGCSKSSNNSSSAIVHSASQCPKVDGTYNEVSKKSSAVTFSKSANGDLLISFDGITAKVNGKEQEHQGAKMTFTCSGGKILFVIVDDGKTNKATLELKDGSILVTNDQNEKFEFKKAK